MSFRFIGKVLAGMGVSMAALLTLPYLIRPPARKLYMRRELVTPDDQFVEVDGVQLRYRVMGEGRPLILVHGFASSLVTWYRNVAELARHYRVYALDLKGWGLSDKPTEGDYSWPAQARLLYGFMRALNIVRPILVGHSMGGAVSLHTTIAHPDAVTGLALIAPAGGHSFPYVNALSHAWDAPPLRRWFRLAMEYALTNDELLTSQMPRAYYDPAHCTPEMKRALIQPFHTEGFVDALLNFARDVRYNGVDGLWSRVTCPVLILWGEQDGVLPVADSQYFVEHLPQAQLRIIPAAGHLPHEEKPNAVNPLILAFAQQLMG
jgi:pimeloyl-ACP methyl ester carboxylesterase